ncbi:hypothetical protein CHL76_08335 [Marinococcus halophilus]|uniref:Uncharacterized protein n=1 Tax=Marinococcus halophilus TaxID=1371 RepID=A0A510YA37_MARHA|nr:hypothetical protein [Marinococcus halophilus]OZT80105.1 hypothetical protein CHL76_08335 [Marinococcus halophilus]GEK60266.1 hypothetical protein MHA01_31710 [Marinococcus halophilus]
MSLAKRWGLIALAVSFIPIIFFFLYLYGLAPFLSAIGYWGRFFLPMGVLLGCAGCSIVFSVRAYQHLKQEVFFPWLIFLLLTVYLFSGIIIGMLMLLSGMTHCGYGPC